jgi:type VII secretion integral membrane protein EccD
MAVVNADTGLAKVVVITSQRQLELALPEHLPVSALLPTLVRQGGDDLPAQGATVGGWVLRRTDGTALDTTRTLAEQAVRDGELLHLLPGRTEWPQVQYDDVVDAIALGAQRGGPAWTPAATRATGLTAAVVTLLLLPPTVLLSGGPWLLPAAGLLALAAGLVVVGTVLSRALADSLAGAVVSAVALPYALVGGTLLLGAELPMDQLGAAHLLLGCCCLLLIAVAGFIGVADLRSVFVAAMVVAATGILAAGLDLYRLDQVGAAAVVVTAVLIVSPALPLLSVRMAKVPMPSVPRDTADLRAGDALPPLERVLEQVGRSLELLAGALLGVAVVSVTGVAVLAWSQRSSALLLAAVVSAGHLLRARMLVALRQRLPLLLAGGVGLAIVTGGLLATLPGWARFALVLPVLVLIAGTAVAAAQVFARRKPSPYLGRLANILDVVLTLAAGPMAAGVIGMYGFMRGLSG